MIEDADHQAGSEVDLHTDLEIDFTPQPMREDPPFSPPRIPSAGFWLRAWSMALDTFFYLLVWIGVGVVWDIMNQAGQPLPGPLRFAMKYVLPPVLTLVFWLWLSATPGKVLNAIRIVRKKDLGRPGLPQLLLRYMGYFISALPLFLGFAWAGFDREKRTWHDRIAGTVVIREGAPLIGLSGYALLVVLVAISGFGWTKYTNRQINIRPTIHWVKNAARDIASMDTDSIGQTIQRRSDIVGEFSARLGESVKVEPDDFDIQFDEAERYVGQILEVTTKDTDTFRAILTKVERKQLTLEQRIKEGNMVSRLSRSEIARLRVVHSFEPEKTDSPHREKKK